MKTVITDISPSRKKVVVSVPAEAVQAAEATVLADFVRHARLPGFRPGKAPLNLIRGRHAKAIAEELVTKVVQAAYQHVSQDMGLNVFTVVKAEPGTVELGLEAEVMIEVDLAPDIQLTDYQGIAISIPSVVVTPEEVEAAIQERQRSMAKFEVAERAAEKGDYVKLSYKGTLDGKPLTEIIANQPLFSEQKNTWEEAGAEDAPGIKSIISGIIGLKAGDEATFKETFAEDFREAALAGKTADYEVNIHEVRTRILPALDDAEFLKQHAVETVEALKEAVTKRLQDAKEGQSRDLQANKVMEHLRETTTFHIPESAVDAKMPEMVDRFLASEAARQASPEALQRDKDQILSDLRGLALRRLQEEFLLEKVAELEKIQLAEEDMQRGVWHEAMMQRMQVPEYVKKLQKDQNALRAFQRRMLHHKTLEFLVKAAKVTQVA